MCRHPKTQGQKCKLLPLILHMQFSAKCARLLRHARMHTGLPHRESLKGSPLSVHVWLHSRVDVSQCLTVYISEGSFSAVHDLFDQIHS